MCYRHPSMPYHIIQSCVACDQTHIKRHASALYQTPSCHTIACALCTHGIADVQRNLVQRMWPSPHLVAARCLRREPWHLQVTLLLHQDLLHEPNYSAQLLLISAYALNSDSSLQPVSSYCRFCSMLAWPLYEFVHWAWMW